MKKIISSVLVGAILLCSFASGIVFADESATSIPTTIAEKTLKESTVSIPKPVAEKKTEGLAASQAQKNGVKVLQAAESPLPVSVK